MDPNDDQNTSDQNPVADAGDQTGASDAQGGQPQTPPASEPVSEPGSAPEPVPPVQEPGGQELPPSPPAESPQPGDDQGQASDESNPVA